MGVWLVCCGPSNASALYGELRARDSAAQILRVGDASAMGRMVDAFPSGEISAAVAVGGGSEAHVEAGIGDIARSGRARELLVYAESADPAFAARMFYAGATEVIAAGGSGELERVSEGACVAKRQEIEDVCADLDGDDLGCAETPLRVPTAGGGRVCRAPVVVAVSGRGGSGKTMLTASLAVLAATWGLKAAVIDLDAMFGNLYSVLGLEEASDMGTLLECRDAAAFDRCVEMVAAKVAPGLTLWGPLREPEKAELIAPAFERLLGVVGSVADVVFVDTSTFWGDAVAAAVSRSDRCLIVGGPGSDAGPSAARAVALVAKMGVPGTRMTSVYNRLGAHRAGEDAALRFEMGAALRSKARIADGGDEAASVSSYAHLKGLVDGQSAYAQSVRAFAKSLLGELGCRFDDPDAWGRDEGREGRPRIRLPWKKGSGEAA